MIPLVFAACLQKNKLFETACFFAKKRVPKGISNAVEQTIWFILVHECRSSNTVLKQKLIDNHIIPND